MRSQVYDKIKAAACASRGMRAQSTPEPASASMLARQHRVAVSMEQIYAGACSKAFAATRRSALNYIPTTA